MHTLHHVTHSLPVVALVALGVRLAKGRNARNSPRLWSAASQ
jgi:hypothetical protein